MRPVAAALDEDGQRLKLEGPDGASRVIEADLLWRECPSALFRRRRIDGHQLVTPQGIRILEVRPVGRYGVNLVFSDGNDRGIYPWTMLAELAARPSAQDFILPAADVTHARNTQSIGEGA